MGGEHEELLRVWRAGDRMREEIQGGPEAGSSLVRVGRRWWRRNERYGVSSGERDSMAGGIGGRSWVMFNPTALAYVLRLRLVGRGQRAGRKVILAEGSPRAPGRDQIHSLVQLGWGADRYRLEVDAERGILLGAVAVRGGEPFQEITAVTVALDEPIDDERFVFRPPAG